jgi:hypothetical protein
VELVRGRRLPNTSFIAIFIAMRHTWNYLGTDPYVAKRRTCRSCPMEQKTFGAGAGRHWDWRLGQDDRWHIGKAPECTAVPERPLILIDFDGVVSVEASAARRRHLCYHHGWRQRRTGPHDERIFYNPAVGPWLSRLARETGAELAWGSMREEWAGVWGGWLIGLPGLPVSPAGSFYLEDEDRMCKSAGIVPWTKGRPFVWFDDEEENVQDAAEMAGSQPHLVILTDEHTGLTEAHIEQARTWLLALEGR